MIQSQIVSSFPNLQGVLIPIGAVAEQLTLSASTSHLLLPLPAGVTTASYVIVQAVTSSDLTAQLSLAGGSTVLSIPAYGVLVLYGVTTLYVNSALGGVANVYIGGPA